MSPLPKFFALLAVQLVLTTTPLLFPQLPLEYGIVAYVVALAVAAYALWGVAPIAAPWSKWAPHLAGSFAILLLIVWIESRPGPTAFVGWVIIVALALLMAALVISAATAFLPSVTPSAVSAPARTTWEIELHDHRLDRREFWRLLETAYGNWTMRPEPNRSLRDVVRGANMPRDLPLADNSQFPAWAWAAETYCHDGDARQLLQFASAIYIAATPPATIKSQLMGTTQEFDRFDTIRMELAKFWDYWGRQEPLEQVIGEQKADPIVKAHATEIKMLTFLEVARVRWENSDLPGKNGLFHLCRRNAETGDQSSDSRTD